MAPLGTALTADQLALLWKMADEPMLCFDGDGAGRRAAYRAVDLALPLLKPGKSLKFASLPEGHDPDDLVRAGGREAVAEVLGAARPLAHVLWMRETEAGGLDTPERRAAFEARLAEVMATIGDETVRKYYRQEFGERLRQLFETDVRPKMRPRPGRMANSDSAEHDPAAQRPIAIRSPGVRDPASPCVPLLASLTWWRARSWPRARSIAATAPPFRCARR